MTDARDDHPLVVAVLSRKRAEIAGIVSELENQLAARRRELVNIDAVLTILDPSIDLTVIRAKRRRPDPGPFLHGELTRRVYVSLRERGEVSAVELAEAAIRDKGCGDTMRADFTARFLVRLAQMANAGRVERIGSGNGVRWKLAATA